MSKPKVLLSRRWPEAVEARASELYDVTLNEADTPMTAADFRKALAEHDAVLPTVTDHLGSEVFEGVPRARILANYGVGFSHIDTGAAAGQGIVVSNTPQHARRSQRMHGRHCHDAALDGCPPRRRG